MFPIAAASGEAAVEGRLEHVDGEVVMDLCDLPGSLARLPVLQPRHGHQKGEVHRQRKAGTQASADHACEELVEPLAGEPAVHIGFAEAHRALRQHAAVKSLVLNLDVPRVSSVDLDLRERKEIAHDRLGVHDSKPLQDRCNVGTLAFATKGRSAAPTPRPWVRCPFRPPFRADFIPRPRGASTRKAQTRLGSALAERGPYDTSSTWPSESL